jgi:replication factor C subunit 2/4
VSRCSKFRFKPLDQSNTTARLKMICTAENVQYEDDVRSLAFVLVED